MQRRLSKAVKSMALCFVMFASASSYAQGYIEIEPLFEYITAPEEITPLNEKSNYLVEHFWDNMDFKTKSTVDQTALNHAFNVYATPLRFADKEKASAAVDKLLDTLSKNPVLLLQFTKAAEENIFGPRADAWIDEVYIKFLNTLIKNKKITPQRKEKYQRQLTMIENSKIGNTAPSFSFENKNGGESTYFPMSTPSIIIFGNPVSPDWRITRLRMETNAQLTQAVDKGKLNVLFIIPDKIDNWREEVANYPQRWTVGVAENIGDKIDIRAKSDAYFASVYYVGSDGKIVMKNVPLESAVDRALEDVN